MSRTMIKGATYQSERGPVVYEGLDYFCGELTYQFSRPRQRPIYIRPDRLEEFLAPVSANKETD